jgi:hypothetical protein
MAKLPELFHPTTDVIIPSTKMKTKIRPMLVKEEKILLMAKLSDTGADIYNAIKQICQNCLVNDDVKIDDLTLFDLEYLFLKIRAISVSDKVNLTFIDKEDSKEYSFEVDLNKVEVNLDEAKDNKIELGPDEGFVMQFPKASFYNSELFKKKEVTDTDVMDELIKASIQMYFQGDKVYNFNENTQEEIKKFLDNMDIKTYNKLQDYVANLPSLKHELKYTNSLGHEREIVLSTLNDFFTLV